MPGIPKNNGHGFLSAPGLFSSETSQRSTAIFIAGLLNED
jgi:hypothetical protein